MDTRRDGDQVSPFDLAALIENGAATPAHHTLYTAFVLIGGTGLGAVLYAAGMSVRDVWKRVTR
jgi:hypothetical protein